MQVPAFSPLIRPNQERPQPKATDLPQDFWPNDGADYELFDTRANALKYGSAGPNSDEHQSIVSRKVSEGYSFQEAYDLFLLAQHRDTLD